MGDVKRVRLWLERRAWREAQGRSKNVSPNPAYLGVEARVQAGCRAAALRDLDVDHRSNALTAQLGQAAHALSLCAEQPQRVGLEGGGGARVGCGLDTDIGSLVGFAPELHAAQLGQGIGELSAMSLPGADRLAVALGRAFLKAYSGGAGSFAACMEG